MGIQLDLLCNTAHTSEAVILPLYTDPLSQMFHVVDVTIVVEPLIGRSGKSDEICIEETLPSGKQTKSYWTWP